MDLTEGKKKKQISKCLFIRWVGYNNLQEKCIYFISVLEKCWKRIKLFYCG